MIVAENKDCGHGHKKMIEGSGRTGKYVFQCTDPKCKQLLKIKM